MKAQQCFLHHRNNVYAVLNWRVRKNEFDVMLLDPLDTQEFGRYQKLMKEGFTDESIFKKFYPEKIAPKKKILIKIELLSKEQLTHLINIRLGSTLTSMIRMSTEDLRSLFLEIEELASTH
jgi:hypothetical protein